MNNYDSISVYKGSTNARIGAHLCFPVRVLVSAGYPSVPLLALSIICTRKSRYNFSIALFTPDLSDGLRVGCQRLRNRFLSQVKRSTSTSWHCSQFIAGIPDCQNWHDSGSITSPRRRLYERRQQPPGRAGQNLLKQPMTQGQT